MIGIIGGSGFYNFLENAIVKEVDTPFGTVEMQIGSVNGHEVGFIPRHGSNHTILPSEINYRANIFAAHKEGITKIFATNAVGSGNKKIGPGSFVVFDQILDNTYGRPSTFFNGSDLKITTRTGKTLQGVVHTDVTYPFDQVARMNLIEACKENGEKVQKQGTIAVFNGPRYETPAEIKAYTMLGADYFGMTSSPEAFLAKEIEIQYATLALVTNYAAGLQSEVTHTEVEELFRKRIDVVKGIFRFAISSYGLREL